MKSKYWLISALIGLFVLFGNILVPHLYLRTIAESSGLKEIFIKRLEKNYPIRVYCSAMRYRGGGIEFTELRINTLDKKPLLKVPLTRIDLDFWRLILHPTSANNAISRLVFLKPSLYITKDAKGHWNFEKLKSHSSKKSEMDLKISIKNGRLFMPSDIAGWRPGNLDRINGEIGLSPNHQMVWKINGHTLKDQRIVLKSEGTISPDDASGQMIFKAQNLSLGLLEREVPAKYKPVKWGFTNFTGECNAEVRLNQSKKGWYWGQGAIRLTNGGVRWSKIGQPINGVSGDFEVSPDFIRVNKMSGKIGGSLVRLNGEADLTGTHPERQLAIQTSDLPIGTFNKIYPGLSAWKIQGLADIRLRLAMVGKKPQLRGEVHVSNASVQSANQKLSLARIESLLIFDDQGIQLHYLNGYWDDTRLEANGYLRDWNNLHWDIQIKSDRLDITPLIKSFPVRTGDLSVKTKIVGALRQPVLGWEVGTKTLSWKQLEGHDLSAKGSYDLSSGLVKVEDMRVGLGEAWLKAKGEIETKEPDPKFNAELWGDSLELSEILSKSGFAKKNLSITGQAAFKLSCAGRLKDPKTWVINGTADGMDGSINKLRYQRFSSKYTYQKSMLHIEAFRMEQSDGKLWASGLWSPAAGLQGKVNLEQFGMKLTIPGRVSKELTGTASGEFQLACATDLTTMAGKGYLNIDRVRLGENTLGNIHLLAETDKERLLHLDGSNIQLNSGETIKIDGAVDLNKNLRLDLHVHSENINLASLGNWTAPDSKVVINGKAGLDLLVKGALFNPNVNGTLATNDLGVSGHPLGNAEIAFNWKDGNLEIPEGSIKQGEGTLNFNGRLGLKENDLSIKAVHYPLGELSFKLGGVKVQGELGFEGQMQGDLINPEMKGLLSVRDLNLGGLIFQTVNGEIAWKDRILSTHEIVVSRDKQRLTLQGDLKFAKNPEINLDANLETTRLRELMLVIGLRPRVPIDGDITGNLKLQGLLSSPRIRLKSELNDGFVADYSQLDGNLDVEVYEKVISIHQLVLNGPSGILKVNGTYEPEKRAEFDLNLNDFDLQPLGAIIRSQEIIEGRLDLQAQVRYGARGMQGEVSGRIREGKWRNVLLPFTDLNAQIRDNVLSLTLNQQDLGLVLRGEGPINSEWLKSFKLPGTHVNGDLPMRWELNAPAVSGNMIEKISPQAHFTNGNIGIGIVLDGTWKSPNLHGAISIKHLKGKVDLLPETFSEMNGLIRINGSKLEIINFDSKYGKGRASVSGGLSLRGLIPDQLDLAIHIDRFHYKSPGFESMINSDFKITGTISDPLISGKAVINKSTISIVRSKRLKRFDPRLDILVHSGKENYFRQVGLANVLVHGDLHIGGTLTYPELLGKVSSNRGTLTLYGTTFRLVEATSEFDPKNGLFPYISGQAKTRKDSVEITLTARGWTNQTLEMHLESRPAMSYEEIVSLLHWTDREGGLALLQGNVNAIVDSLVGSRLNQFGNTIGLDFFDIDQEQFSGPFRLNLGKSITKDLYLSYSRTLDPLGEDYWILEYSLSPNISLLGEYTEEDGTTLQLDFHFRF